MKIDQDKYCSLLYQRVYSRDDKGQDAFLATLSERLKAVGFTTETDDYGNLMAIRNPEEKPFIPCIVAHVDINQSKADSPTIYIIGDYVVGFENGIQKGCGHDDRAGVYFGLHVAEETDLACKILYTKDEEVGGLGAAKVSKDFFHNVSLCLQLDRRGSSDISEWTNGVSVVSKDFQAQMKPLLETYGYKFTTCVFTDVGVLKSDLMVDMCCMNISCGYYSEHSQSERLNWNEYITSCYFALDIIEKFGYVKQAHTPTKKYTGYKNYTKPDYNFTGKTDTFSTDNYYFNRDNWAFEKDGWVFTEPYTKTRWKALKRLPSGVKPLTVAKTVPALTKETTFPSVIHKCDECGEEGGLWDGFTDTILCIACQVTAKYKFNGTTKD